MQRNASDVTACKLQQIFCSSYVYTLRLIGPISYLGACYIRTKVTKCICEKMTLLMYSVLSWVNREPLNHMHQLDTKSARLMAVCKRSIFRTKSTAA